MTQTEAAFAPPRRVLLREVVLASFGVLVLLTAVKHLAGAVPAFADYAFTIAIAFQLYLPIYFIGKRGISKASLGLTFRQWRKDLLGVGVLSLLTILPFAVGHHYWQTLIWGQTFHFQLPKDLLINVATQLWIVALAEELYFRGYLQERLTKLLPPRGKLFGMPFGLAIVIAAAVFDLAHFVGEYRIDRLGRFFPGLLFGLLRARTGTIVGAVSYHAFCNILSDTLSASYIRAE